MLTGFDSKWLNALYLDKVLQYENIIQAFSRTNRIYNEQDKPFGIIKYYRKPYTMERNISEAIKLYSGNKPFQLYVPKLDENINKMNTLYSEIEDLFTSEGIENFESVPNSKESKRKFVKLYNEFNKYLSAAIIQGYTPKNDVDIVEETLNTTDELFDPEMSTIEKNELSDRNYTNNLILNSPITTVSLDAIRQRYIDIGKTTEISLEDEVPYDIEANIIEIDDGKIDSDYMNSKFKKYVKELNKSNVSEEEIQLALNNLHKSFASLPQEKQKYANMLIHDIESGDIVIDENKSFMDYITEYEVNAENNQIRKLSNAFGVSEEKLKNIMATTTSMTNINEFGKYEDLLKTVDLEKAKKTLEKIYNRELEKYEVNLNVDEILRKFIVNDGFDIETIIK